MTPADELRAAVALLQGPVNTVPIADVAGPLADLLLSVAVQAERHEAKGWGNDQSEVIDDRYSRVARAIREVALAAPEAPDGES